MKRRPFLLLLLLLTLTEYARAQQASSSSQIEKTATPRSVTGTYQNVLNTIKVSEAARGQVLIDFVGFWPNVSRSQLRKNGMDTYNSGSFNETVPLQNGVAVVKLSFADTPCVIRISFLPGKLKVKQEATPDACGFGFNVEADGIYLRAKKRNPQSSNKSEK